VWVCASAHRTLSCGWIMDSNSGPDRANHRASFLAASARRFEAIRNHHNSASIFGCEWRHQRALADKHGRTEMDVSKNVFGNQSLMGQIRA